MLLRQAKNTNMTKNIDFEAIKAGKNEMLQRFLKAKAEAEKNGQVKTKPIAI